LRFLDCSYNQLTSTALNALFETLPENNNISYKGIAITNNPGTGDCDKSIAENKGWEVS
jgi:hypothetical protein